ncbi:peptidase M50 [Mycolicibacterium sp. 120266]|uniref:peptidase M50 n=1 Tax=Mycolicibacterium sp. 120266 TaxID=3090601 RepID=UPI0039A40AC8
MTTTDGDRAISVLVFGGRRIPRALGACPAVMVAEPADIDAAFTARRLVVVGSESDLATVLGRLMRADRLDIEVARVGRWRSGRRARTGAVTRLPLIRDETGTVLVGTAYWLPPDEAARHIEGEAVVDDTVLFDGSATAVRIEPIAAQPGLRASVLTARMRPKHWVTGRAVQLGTTGALVVRDGVQVPRPVRRSTFYRHTQGWLAVR